MVAHLLLLFSITFIDQRREFVKTSSTKNQWQVLRSLNNTLNA